MKLSEPEASLSVFVSEVKHASAPQEAVYERGTTCLAADLEQHRSGARSPCRDHGMHESLPMPQAVHGITVQKRSMKARSNSGANESAEQKRMPAPVSGSGDSTGGRHHTSFRYRPLSARRLTQASA